MSNITYVGGDVAPPKIGQLGADRRRGRDPSPDHAFRFVYLPAIISVGDHLLFFIAYWMPELTGFPGHRILLTELAPLVSKELTSEANPVVSDQADHSGLAGAYLLIASLALPMMARAHYWLARLGLWVLTYVAGIFAVIITLGLVVRGQFVDGLLSVALLVVWLAAAGITSWRSLWLDVGAIPPKPRTLWLLGAYALINPAPVAVGRRLFAPELRVAATEVMGGGFVLQWTALITPATFPVFLSGLSVGVVGWALYSLVPPMEITRRTAVSVLAVGLLVVASSGAWAGSSAADRVDQLRLGSPADEVGFGCGSSIQRRPGQPAVTLTVSGAGCTKLTSFAGYRQVAQRTVTPSLSPVAMHTPEGQVLSTPFVSAPYGPLIVVAATERFDNRATVVWGLRYADTAQVWSFSCPSARPMRLRFAGSSAGDSLLAGHLTVAGEPPTVFVACDGGANVRLDPRTGRVW